MNKEIKELLKNWKFIIAILIIAVSGWLLYMDIIEMHQERIQVPILKTQQNAVQTKNVQVENESCPPQIEIYIKEITT